MTNAPHHVCPTCKGEFGRITEFWEHRCLGNITTRRTRDKDWTVGQIVTDRPTRKQIELGITPKSYKVLSAKINANGEQEFKLQELANV
jgi:hypothetical protein